MKKNIIFIFLIFTFFSQRSSSQVIEKYNVIKISPLVLFKGQIIEVHYERALSKIITASIGIAPIFYGEMPTNDTVPFKGIALDPEIRLYPNSAGMFEGFFIGLYSSLRYSTLNNSKYLVPDNSWLNFIFGDYRDDIKDTTFKTGDKYNVKKAVYIWGIQLGTENTFRNNVIFNFYSGVGIGTKNYTSENIRTKFLLKSQFGKINLRFNVSIGYRF